MELPECLLDSQSEQRNKVQTILKCYKRSILEPCLYTKNNDGKRTTVALYVDVFFCIHK